MSKFSIKTSIIVFLSIIIFFVVAIIMFFQYRSINEFALLTTQKVFDRITDKVIHQIEDYDIQSKNFINISKNIKNIDNLPQKTIKHPMLNVMAGHISGANYIYAIYIGYSNDYFYEIINLNLTSTIKEQLKTPKNARWLIIKHLKEEGIIVRIEEYLDENYNLISSIKKDTDYRPTKRPWYKKAIKNKDIVKTEPYMFSTLKEPGVTYAQSINNDSIIALDISLSSLSKLLSKQELVKGSKSFIFENDGKVIGQFDSNTKDKLNNINDKYKEIFIKDGKVLDLEVQKTLKIDGVEYLKYTTLLKSSFDTKDYLTILSPIETIMMPYKQKIYKALGLTMLILILFVLPIVFYLIRLIVRPILELEEENKKIEKGKFEEVRHVDSFMIEIDSLSNSLVHMSDAIEEKTKTIIQLLSAFDKNVIASKTDLKGDITYASEAFCKTSGYSKEELIGNSHRILRDPQMPKEVFEELWETITSKKQWRGEVRNIAKDGHYYWVDAIIMPDYNYKGELIGYNAIRHDITSQKEVEDLTKNLEKKVKQRTKEVEEKSQNISNLLNNAAQGFLYFDKDMIIGSEYSKEAKKIFSQDISGLDISKLLYDDEDDRLFFISTLQGILDEDEFRQEILISLLKKEFKIDNIFIEVEYKVLDKNSFMMIITDVTATKKLTQKIKDEQQVLKMVVEIITSLEQFISIKSDYEKFIQNIDNYKSLNMLSNLRKEIHTYKGLFAQKEMLHVVKQLHEFESLIDENLKQNSIDQSIKDITTTDVLEWLNKDINILKDILGENFFDKSNNIIIDKNRIDELHNNIVKFAESKGIKDCSFIKDGIKQLKYSNIKTFLKPYEKLVTQLSLRLEKHIHPLIINTQDIYLSDDYKPFLNSLVHIFRNSVDHGIESAQKREELAKELYGTITCDVIKEDDNLIIKIKDDGQGIDEDKIKTLAVQKGIYTQDEIEKMDKKEILLIIFEDAFSTSETISDISGRGVGLASIIKELNILNGTIDIQNNFTQGVEFIFTIPYKV